MDEFDEIALVEDDLFGLDQDILDATITTSEHNITSDELRDVALDINPSVSDSEECVPENVMSGKALKHFDSFTSQCTCAPNCDFNEYKSLSSLISTMNEYERKNIISAILLPITSPPGETNSLNSSDETRYKNLNYKRRLISNTLGYNRSIYCLFGTRVCQNVMAAVLQVHPRTLNTYANELNVHGLIISTNIKKKEMRKGSRSLQTEIIRAFLMRYADIHALPCPTGRGSENERPVLWLPVSTVRSDLYDLYKIEWDSIGNGLIQIMKTNRNPNKLFKIPANPIVYDAFVKIWRQHCNFIRILNKGSDFCDVCTNYKNSIGNASGEVKRELLERYTQHRHEAAIEYKNYKRLMEECSENPEGETVHLLFDFAEKVLLPRLIHQPGQLHFTTSLKFDMFGIYCSNIMEMFVYGLTEGHWPSHKTGNEVFSMVHYQIDLFASLRSTPTEIKHLMLHADNCGGQNKNRFMIWYFAWRVIAGLNETIELYFLVAGHTKNRADAGFGLVKRKLKQYNAIVPADMMKVIEISSESNTCVCGSDVIWYDWKRILEPHFTIPKDLKITQYHVFKFDACRPGVVQVKPFSYSSSTEFNILKNGYTVQQAREGIAEAMMNSTCLVPITPLHEVPSAYQGNRHAYLMKNVLDRYYPNDTKIRAEYFENGTAFRHDHFKLTEIQQTAEQSP